MLDAGRGWARRSNPIRKTCGVAVIGTGGLSHQLTGPDFGKVFAHWDREFLTLLDHAPQSLVRYTMADFAHLGGEH